MTSPLHNTSLLSRRNSPAPRTDAAIEPGGILSQELFARTLFVERKRTERSGRSFVLMLLESTRLLKAGDDSQSLSKVLDALSRSSRDTDTRGWYKTGTTLGVIFTELGADVEGNAVAAALLGKVTKALSDTLAISDINEIRLSFHVFPDDWAKSGPHDPPDSGYYDDLVHQNTPRRLHRLAKRAMDISGSLCALLFGLPLFLCIAVAIKLTSPGPVLFCQPRLGQYGRKFNFLKFRSMRANNDATIHQEFVKSFIVSGSNGSAAATAPAPYKIAADPRITPIGHFLRRTSLDELPQFLNVLLGDMSLVGPRPPLPYEVEVYRIWHRTRLLAAKPGITGIWQVAGRSRVKFDDMVRMDLQYATTWTLWLDIKILFQTPRAVFSANGAR